MTDSFLLSRKNLPAYKLTSIISGESLSQQPAIDLCRLKNKEPLGKGQDTNTDTLRNPYGGIWKNDVSVSER